MAETGIYCAQFLLWVFGGVAPRVAGVTYALDPTTGLRTVFFEETSLVARPGLPLKELERRTYLRLEHLGVELKGKHPDEPDELSYIPMGGSPAVWESTPGSMKSHLRTGPHRTKINGSSPSARPRHWYTRQLATNSVGCSPWRQRSPMR